MAKEDFVRFVMDVCLYPYVSLCVDKLCYITDLHAYGSEALDQHNDGDSMKTRRDFKLGVLRFGGGMLLLLLCSSLNCLKVVCVWSFVNADYT